MRAALLGLCLAGLALSAGAAQLPERLPEQNSSARRSLSGQAPPKCATVFYTRPDGQRVRLPACSQPPTTDAGGSAAAESVAAAAALGAPSNAYPCNVGDSACFCRWKGTLGFFADNDADTACT